MSPQQQVPQKKVVETSQREMLRITTANSPVEDVPKQEKVKDV